MTDMPSPPRSQPTSARARSTSAFDMPQRSMTVPAKMKLGIASKTQFCDAADHARRQHLERIAAEHQTDDRGDAKREHDRHRQRDQADKDDPGGGEQHRHSSPAVDSGSRPAASAPDGRSAAIA